MLGLVLFPAAAQAAWSPPFDLVAPGSLDYLPTQLAISPSGQLAAAYSVQDVDTPASAQAYLVLRSPSGTVSSPLALTGAREVLALAYSRRGLELLTGASPRGLDCCSSAQVLRITGTGTLGGTQTVLGGLTGSALGALAPLTGAPTVAAVATERGVWAAQSGPAGVFGRARRLTAAGLASEALSATALDGGRSLVAWTAAGGPPGTADPRAIFYGLGSRLHPPRRASVLLRVPPGDRIDELAVARRRGTATAAWVHGSFGARNDYRSSVQATDFAAHSTVRSFPAGGSQAAGLSLAGDAAGAQGLTWKACRTDGSCTVQLATRGPGARFRGARSLGPIDASQTPALAVGPGGQVLVGWIRGGRPVAVLGAAGSGRLGPVRVLSPSVYAYDETVAYGAHGGLAAWTQGTLNPSVVASAYP